MKEVYARVEKVSESMSGMEIEKFHKQKIRTGKMAENSVQKNFLLVNLFCDWVL